MGKVASSDISGSRLAGSGSRIDAKSACVYLLLPTMFFLTESSTHSNGYRIRKVTKVTADTLEEFSKILDGVNAGFCRLFVSSMQLCLQTIPYKSFDERTAVRGAC